MFEKDPQHEGTKKRGFGSMSPERQREIASKGGRAAHERGSAHEFTTDEARAAGRKGGVSVSQNREHMAEIGRRGGQARGAAHRQRVEQARHAAESEEAPPASTTRGAGDDEERQVS